MLAPNDRLNRSGSTQTFIRILCFACVALFMVACNAFGNESATKPGAATAKLTGTVTYRERIALTPQAVVEVQLLDVSRADAMAKQIAVQTIKPTHQVPIPFEISYDPSAIDARLTYAVRATIRDGGRLLFTTDRHYPVLTQGQSRHAELVLVRVRSDDR